MYNMQYSSQQQEMYNQYGGFYLGLDCRFIQGQYLYFYSRERMQGLGQIQMYGILFQMMGGLLQLFFSEGFQQNMWVVCNDMFYFYQNRQGFGGFVQVFFYLGMNCMDDMMVFDQRINYESQWFFYVSQCQFYMLFLVFMQFIMCLLQLFYQMLLLLLNYIFRVFSLVFFQCFLENCMFLSKFFFLFFMKMQKVMFMVFVFQVIGLLF